MLRANGGVAPVGDESELRCGVAIIGSGPAGAIAAATVRQQAPDLSVVIIKNRLGADVLPDQALSPDDAGVLREIGVVEPTDPQALIAHAAALGADVLDGVAVRRADSVADRIDRLHLEDGRAVVADWYVDASPEATHGTSGENWLPCRGVDKFGVPAALLVGRDAGCTVAALHRGGHDAPWLLWSYHHTTRHRVEECQRNVTDGPRELHLCNIIKPILVGARQDWIAEFRDGEVQRVPCYERDGKVLPVAGVFEQLLAALKHHTVVADVLAELQQLGQSPLDRYIDGLESMLQDGWLIGRLDRRRPLPDWSANAKPSATISTFTQTHEPIRK